MNIKEDYYFTENPYLQTFTSAEEAWFWCCRCRTGERVKFTKTDNSYVKICETNDIYISLKKLQLKGLINPHHIRTLVRFGIKQAPPDTRFGDSNHQCLLWSEALNALEKDLRIRGIVE